MIKLYIKSSYTYLLFFNYVYLNISIYLESSYIVKFNGYIFKMKNVMKRIYFFIILELFNNIITLHF